jgi:predicted RNA polymerase sigma factor
MNADAQTRLTADAVARRSYGKLIAFLAARTRDVAAAEDALSDAFAAALADWPRTGCPANPEAWLLTVARRKLIDGVRRQRSGERVAAQLLALADEIDAPSFETGIADQRLALMFACAHPAIDEGVRAPLMLQTVLGLDAAMIASAFVASPAAMSQRLVRAKAKIRQAGIAFRIPEPDELAGRLEAVLGAVYAAFSEGWVDPDGTDMARRDLAEEALYLGRLIAQLMPEESEVLGLLALMLHAQARRRARRDGSGEYVRFADQDTTLWDWRMIDEAEALLLRASALGAIGRYQLEAALQSAHVHRKRAGQNNWRAIVTLYDALLRLASSPVVAVNRAIAIAELHGAHAGLAALAAVDGDPRLTQFQPDWAARAQLLAGAGEHAEARRAYDIAIGLERDPAVRRFLLRQANASALPR